MRALIIATEPGLRLRPGGPLGAPLEATAARLIGQDSVDPALARLAAMLSDADLLSSVGLTAAWYHVQLARLESEAGKPHDPADSARFFTAIVGPDFVSLPGRVFSPNLVGHPPRGEPNRLRPFGFACRGTAAAVATFCLPGVPSMIDAVRDGGRANTGPDAAQ